METQIVRSAEDWQRLEPEWRQLVEACDLTSPFMTWEWLETWRRHFAGDDELLVIVCRGAGRCAAILPLVVERRRRRKVEVRRLRLLGAGLSDRLDVLADPAEPTARAALADALVAAADEWDMLELPDIDVQDPAGEAIRAGLVAAGFPAVAEATSRRPYLPVTGEWERIHRTKVSKKTRSKNRSKRRKLDEMGEFRFVSVKEADAVMSTLEEIFAMPERSSYQGDARIRPFDGDRGRAFFREIGREFGRQGWLLLNLARLDGRLIAYEFGIRYRNRHLDYYGGYLQEFYKLSPGRLLTLELLEHCFADRVSEIDFLRGDEDWKNEWTDRYRQNQVITAGNPGLGSRLRRALQAL